MLGTFLGIWDKSGRNEDKNLHRRLYFVAEGRDVKSKINIMSSVLDMYNGGKVDHSKGDQDFWEDGSNCSKVVRVCFLKKVIVNEGRHE